MIFTENHQDRLSLGENALLKLFSHWLGPVNPVYPAGMGDDCAVLQPYSAPTLLTTDTITYGKHFDDSVSAQSAGAKLIKRNVSDIAAMGGTPRDALLTLMCAPNTSLSWLEAFFRGIREACLEYKVQLVGGDVSSLDPGQFSASLSLTGTCPKPLLRRSARIGDRIYVTGTLGGSILGKHYQFIPRVQEGQWLAQQSYASAMMDLTDGLGKDLKELLPAGSSAQLTLKDIPISDAAAQYAKQTQKTPIAHAFEDGEDYELLFTVREAPDHFEADWARSFPNTPLHAIGYIVNASEKGIYIDSDTGQALPWTHGYEHLRENDLDN